MVATVTELRQPDDFYHLGPVLSHNAVYNFIVGARGIGKTYSAKKERAWKDFLRYGHQFIYLRRFKEELKPIKSTLMNDVDTGYDFRTEGDQIMCRPLGADKKEKWKCCGYLIALSQAAQKKSIPYPLVRTIIYDEFIIEVGFNRYIANEYEVFNDFYSTVDRYRDRVRVLFLANSVSIHNPYFTALGIQADGREWERGKKGFWVAHFPDSEAFIERVSDTRFGQFISDSEYAEYALHNKFRDNTTALLGPKDSEATYRFTLLTPTGPMSFWTKGTLFHVTTKTPKEPVSYTLNPAHVSETVQLMTRQDPIVKVLKGQYARGIVTFSDRAARAAFGHLFTRV